MKSFYQHRGETAILEKTRLNITCLIRIRFQLVELLAKPDLSRENADVGQFWIINPPWLFSAYSRLQTGMGAGRLPGPGTRKVLKWNPEPRQKISKPGTLPGKFSNPRPGAHPWLQRWWFGQFNPKTFWICQKFFGRNVGQKLCSTKVISRIAPQVHILASRDF